MTSMFERVREFVTPEKPIKGMETWRLALIILLIALSANILLICTLGTKTNWTVIIGLGIDLIGALIIAAPDFEFLTNFLYVGRLRRGRRKLHDYNAKSVERFVPTNPQPWYQELREEIDKFAFADDIPEEAWFERNPDWPDTLLVYSKDDKLKPVHATARLPFTNLDRHLIHRIEELDSRVRRQGAILLFIGFSLQIVGLLFESAIYQ